MFGSLENFYHSAIQLGYYLPDITESMVTANYLVKVVKKDIWCPKISEIKAGGAKTLKKRQKIQIYESLVRLAEEKEIGEIGMTISRLPSKEYLLNLIWILDNNHDLFKLIPEY